MPLLSRAISHARGHLRVSRFARPTTEKRETARSLDFCGVLLLHHSSIVARPMICFFLVYGSLLNLARTMIPFFAFRQITTDWLVFKIVLALVLDFLTTDPV